MRNVTCRCETNFQADLPEEVDLDSATSGLDDLLSGDFFSVTCPSCGSLLKPELRVRVISASRGLKADVLPETDRLAFYLGNLEIRKGDEVLVGYSELFERARILADDLDPEAVEIIKYYLRLKAEESAPENAEVQVRYHDSAEGRLNFHILGIRKDEVAILPVEEARYGRILADMAKTKKTEPFIRIFKGPYKSLRALDVEQD
jgi:hypothetical protein